MCWRDDDALPPPLTREDEGKLIGDRPTSPFPFLDKEQDARASSGIRVCATSGRGRAVIGRIVSRLAVVTCAMSIVGCARPAGNLFPAIEPALVWPGPPEEARIRLIGVIQDSRDLQAAVTGGEAFMAAVRGKRPPITFTGPHGIAYAPPGRVAVADSGAGAVHIINLDRREHRVAFGFEGEYFGEPVGVAWVGDRLFVSDAKRNEIIVLDTEGRWTAHFGHDGLDRPVGIAYAASIDRLYVANGNQHNVVVFNRDGAFVETIGQRGTEPGSFNWPSHLCVRGDKLYVTDAGNFRVQVLDLHGAPLATIGRRGNAAGDLALPKGVAVDSEGHIYVVDARFENVQIFDSQGHLLLAFGQEGAEPGGFSLPAGIAIDASDRIWITDGGNRRVQVFEYLRAS